MLRLLPFTRVGHIGIYRDPDTLGAVEYYSKLPGDTESRDVIIAAPLLTTANSVIAAVDRVKSAQPCSIKLICLVAAPEGIANLHESHPDVPIFTAAIDERIDERGYIIPGLGMRATACSGPSDRRVIPGTNALPPRHGPLTCPNFGMTTSRCKSEGGDPVPFRRSCAGA